ncbi:MAG: hypothetical protein HYY68_00755 [Thaumarchaeota archaeon]|nr:hypothetical protein [Nitrososphaerota archaeon]
MASTYLADVANLILLLGILYPAVMNFVKTRSSISVMLVVFSLAFLIQNVVAIYFHMTIPYTTAVEFEFMVLTFIQTISFAALAWVTYK